MNEKEKGTLGRATLRLTFCKSTTQPWRVDLGSDFHCGDALVLLGEQRGMQTFRSRVADPVPRHSCDPWARQEGPLRCL